MADERGSHQTNDMVLCSLKKHGFFIGLMLQGRHVKLDCSAKGRSGYKKPREDPVKQIAFILHPKNRLSRATYLQDGSTVRDGSMG